MFSFLRSLFRPKFKSLNTIGLSRSALLHNLEVLQNLQPEAVIFPVLKSNAYGHGIQQVATILKPIDLPYICVDSIPEYYLIKKYAKKRSLLIGETLPSNYRFLHPKRATPCIYTMNALRALMKTGKSRKIHLFLNTGMNREGIQMHELGGFLELLKESRIELEGVMSHFANADEIDSSFCDTQIEAFKTMYALIEQYGYSPTYRHLYNTAGMAKGNDSFFNACRSGIGLFGYSPLVDGDAASEKLTILKPALEVTSTIVSMQRIKKGDIASYGGTFVAEADMTVATIPFGYTEGLNRGLRDKRWVTWKGEKLPIIGTICMNLCIIDTRGLEVRTGDVVTIISPNAEDANTIAEFAKGVASIPYEILVNLDPKAKRIII